MAFKSIVVGFVSLTFAIAIGFIWLPRAFKEYSYVDPKLVITIGIWAIYGIGLAVKKTFGFQGKKIATISIIGFILAFASMAVANALSGFHRFY